MWLLIELSFASNEIFLPQIIQLDRIPSRIRIHTQIVLQVLIGTYSTKLTCGHLDEANTCTSLKKGL